MTAHQEKILRDWYDCDVGEIPYEPKPQLATRYMQVVADIADTDDRAFHKAGASVLEVLHDLILS